MIGFDYAHGAGLYAAKRHADAGDSVTGVSKQPPKHSASRSRTCLARSSEALFWK